MLVFLFDLDDKLTRVQPLIDHVRRVFQDIFQPYEKIAVDERMDRSKLWVLADTITGYTSIFFCLFGEKKNWDYWRFIICVLFNLLPEFFNQGYRLFMDSFYTTNNLINDLFKKQVYVIGAVCSNSSAMPTV